MKIDKKFYPDGEQSQEMYLIIITGYLHQMNKKLLNKLIKKANL